MSTTLNLQISADADDTESAATDVWNNTSYDMAGYYSKAGYIKSYMTFRFPNIQLPVGIEIITATFQIYCGASYYPPSTVVLFENADNPAAPTSDADLSGRPISSGILWVLSAGFGGWQTSPELKSILHPVVDRGGWQKGNALQIHWRPYENVDGNYVTIKMYYDNPTYAAKLSITYKETSRFFVLFP